MQGSSFLLIVVGLLLFYVVLSDKFYCLEGCASCLIFGQRQDGAAPVQPATDQKPVSLPGGLRVPSIQNFPSTLAGIQGQLRGVYGS